MDSTPPPSESTPHFPATAPVPSPLTAALVAQRTRILKRRKNLGRDAKLALGLFIVVLAAAVTVVGARVYKHVGAAAWVFSNSGRAEWVFEDEWKSGGSTDVRFAPNYGYIVLRPQHLAGADLRKLRDLYRIRSLQLFNNAWFNDADLEALRGLTSIRTLDLTRRLPGYDKVTEPIPKLTDAALLPLATLVNLTDLVLTGNDITDDGLKSLAGLTKIEYLDLSETQVTDAGLDHLKGMTSLKQVSVGRTKVTAEGVKKLKEALPGVEVDIVDELELIRQRERARLGGLR